MQKKTSCRKADARLADALRSEAKSSGQELPASRYLLRPTHGTLCRSAVFVRQTAQGIRAMAMVMISCPNTGRDVPTGIETDPSSFETFVAAAPIRSPLSDPTHAR